MRDISVVIEETLRRCTRQPIADGVIPRGAELRGELGIDSLGMLMLFEMVGETLQVDPVMLSKRASELVTFGDLVAEVTLLLKR